MLPGSAERIMKMAEKQATHRQKLEAEMLAHSIKTERTGQRLGFAIFIIAILSGVVLMLLGKDGIGLLTALGSLAALIGIFIYDRKSSKKE